MSTLVLTLTLVMGTLTFGLNVGGLRAGEVGLGLLEGDLIVLGIDLGDELADFDLLVVFDVDFDDLAGHARADLVEIAVHLGVVGVLGEGRAPVEDARADDKQDDDRDHDELAAGLLLGGLVFLLIELHGAAGLCGLVITLFCLLWQVTFLRDNLCSLSARRPEHGPRKAWLHCAGRAR